MNQIGFIGAGHIATAIMNGMSRGGIDMSHVLVHAAVPEESQRLKDSIGISIAEDNREVVANSKFIFLAVPAIFYPNVVREVADLASPDHIFVSLTPGYTLQRFHDEFGDAIRVVRIMPNTPAFVAQGMTAVCMPGLSPEEEAEFHQVLSSFGQVEVLPERLMDVIVSVTGSSPAYVYMMIEAMGDAAVSIGLSRDSAYRLAAQALIGSATMVRDTGKHPGALKDDVCTPGGTTIQAVRVLEERGFRSALFEAMLKCHFAGAAPTT